MEIPVNTTASKTSFSLENVIITALQVPGVKVDRESFLRDQFKKENKSLLNSILSDGPIKAGYPQKALYKKATAVVNRNTLVSSGASFAAGLPGGFAMAATIPADTVQFFAIALRTAQEIAYLYGQENLWSDGMLDSEKVMNQLILYIGVMLGSSTASQTVRVLSSSLAQKLLKQLPQKALTKTFYYPIVKSIAKTFGVRMTKDIFAKGVSKAVPVIGGVVSGGITLATMKPMGMRLIDTLDEANFSYTQAGFEADWKDITCVSVETEENEPQSTSGESPSQTNSANSIMEQIKQAKQMLDDGMIDQDDFNRIKEKLISQL